jgi:hypothetical protein
MKRQFYDAIRTGRKTTTLRYWRRAMVRAGSVHTIPHLGKVLIKDVSPIDVNDLTDTDARADGFETPSQLKAALADCYDANTRRERALYRVQFVYLPNAGEASPCQ